MLVIRLVRGGKKNAPSFRIALTQKTAPPKSGKFLELLGHYDARLKQIGLDKERINYWLSKGAKPSVTVHNLLVSQGVIKGGKIKKKIKVKKKEKKEIEGPTEEKEKIEETATGEKEELKKETEKKEEVKEEAVQKEDKQKTRAKKEEFKTKEKKED